MPYELAERTIDENTRIPLSWLYGLATALGGVLIVGAGLMIWGTRLEAKGEFRESRLSKLEVESQQTALNQQSILVQLVEIKVELQHLKGK